VRTKCGLVGGGERCSTVVEVSAIQARGIALGECCYSSKMAWTARAVVVVIHISISLASYYLP
jgi:hypothetical protein